MNTTHQNHMWRLKRIAKSADVNDPTTGQPMHVNIMNMLLPVDWNLNVGLNPNSKVDCANNVGRLSIQAVAPDGSTGLSVIPANATMWSNNQNFLAQSTAFFRQWQAFGCQAEKPMTTTEGLRLVAPRLITGGQVQGDVQPLPGLSEHLTQIVMAANQQLGKRAHLEAAAGRLRVTGTLNGKPVEAWLIAMQTQRTEPIHAGGQLIISDIPLFASPLRLPAIWMRAINFSTLFCPPSR